MFSENRKWGINTRSEECEETSTTDMKTTIHRQLNITL